ncbi:hypothetical protein [Azospirillum melinis]
MTTRPMPDVSANISGFRQLDRSNLFPTASALVPALLR